MGASELFKNQSFKSTDKTTDVWSRPLCIYRGIISPKETDFFTFLGSKKVFEFVFRLFIMQFFSADAMVFSKKF